MSDCISKEIWVEILLRQTLKSLVKCTSVCKEWKSLITDHTFISDHFSRTIQPNNGNCSLFLQLYRPLSPILLSYNEQMDHLSTLRIPLCHRFPFKYSSVVGTCNGLVCLTDAGSVSDSTNVIIWNPSIRKYLLLPKPRITFSTLSYGVSFGLGFNSRTKDFKVVRLLTVYGKEGPSLVEVYSLATGSWRSINCKAPSVLLRSYPWQETWPTPMFINEKLHWVVSRRSRGQIHKFILTFDLVEETFGELMLPECLEQSLCISLGGDPLAVVHTRSILSGQRFFRSFSIWVMKEYGVMESWTEVMHLDSRHYGGIARILVRRSNGEVVLQLCSGAIILLDPMKELVKDLEVKHVSDASVGYHAESLFLLNKENDVFYY